MNCQKETEIIQAMRDACACRNGYAPHDSPALMVMLDNHRKNCPTCQGVPLADQLFGKRVTVSK